MPLIRIDMIEGRSDAEVKTLLDAAHRAVVDAFDVPERDRFQIVNEHPASRMIVEDVGLDIPRTRDVVVVSITSRPRSEASKVKFYELLCRELQQRCGIDPSDVMVSIVINSDSDWSFGHGRAQFLTGEL
ncbi:MAG: tautomerase family protein [Pseudomonas sp.]|nr:tautomerase family protein [Pseudomonas sp.]